MKNIQIGYSIPTAKAFGPKSGISRMRVYVSATNLFTITKYTGLDPEISQTRDASAAVGNAGAPADTFSALGVDKGIYPSPRQFLIGINVGF